MMEFKDSVRVHTKVAGGPWFVELSGGGEPVQLGPYDNPALARADAKRIATFLKELLGQQASLVGTK